MILGTNETPICETHQHRKCLKYARKIMLNELQVRLNCDMNLLERQKVCLCLPPCNDIFYVADITKDDLNATESQEEL
jgi:hypothetical protein